MGWIVLSIYLLSQSNATPKPVYVQPPAQVVPGCVHVSDPCQWPKGNGWTAKIEPQWMHVYVRCGRIMLHEFYSHEQTAFTPANAKAIAQRMSDSCKEQP